jgi:uncharacterized protein YidB (DUF937 family)
MLEALGALFVQNGGIRGLMNKFSDHGLGDVFASWVSTGGNIPISKEQIEQALGHEQVQGMATKLGITSEQAARFLSEHLPDLVNHLTPTGHVEPGTDVIKELTALMPTLLPSFAGTRQ